MRIQFVRDGKNRKVGIVASEIDGNTLRIGWSRMNKKDGKFNRQRGLEIAIGRMSMAGIRTSTVREMPEDVAEVIEYVKARKVSENKQVIVHPCEASGV